MKKMIRIVAGGSSGIGASIIDKFLENQDNIVINVSRRINEKATDNFQCDVSDYKQVEETFKLISMKYRRPISTLIYSAGFVEPNKMINIDPEEWNKTININLNGAFYCTKEFVKFANVNSNIFYIASTAGTRAQTEWSAYASSKAGLINFGLTMSEELKEYGIKVFTLSCGRCATALRKKLAPLEDPNSIMQPSEVAELISNIIKHGSLIDGQNIIVKR
jgi:3-oxoacyl-[acyl-carrier protein] reductase